MQPETATIDLDPDQLAQRAAVYRLLGRFWLNEVDAPLLQSLRATPLREAFAGAGGELPHESDDSDTLEDLAIDFCRLFVGPSGHLPPYQSVWMDAQFQGNAATAMQQQLRALDLPLPAGMADHLGHQLLAMAALLERLASGNSTTLETLNAGRHFFVQHLLWPTELCRQAAERADTGLYRKLPIMTQAFLAEERQAWSVVNDET